MMTSILNGFGSSAVRLADRAVTLLLRIIALPPMQELVSSHYFLLFPSPSPNMPTSIVSANLTSLLGTGGKQKSDATR